MRLLLAAVVIIGHAPEIVDGNRSREPLTVLTHTLSLGEVAVDGFFLLSGFLITKSMVLSKSLPEYMERRVLRIYPAFIVACVMCALVLGPFVGAHPLTRAPQTLIGLVFLKRPYYPGQLPGMPVPDLNGSMWSIPYEFRCYIVVAMLGVLGILKNRWIVLALLALGFLFMALAHGGVGVEMTRFAEDHKMIRLFFADPTESIRLTTIFLVGSCAYLFWEDVSKIITMKVAVFCGLISTAMLFVGPLAEIGLATFGAVFLFWISFKADIGALRNINNSWDISYGVYLYGWPISTAILWFNRGVNPWILAVITLPLAFAFGAASWWGVESWTKNLVRSRSTISAKAVETIS